MSQGGVKWTAKTVSLTHYSVSSSVKMEVTQEVPAPSGNSELRTDELWMNYDDMENLSAILKDFMEAIGIKQKQ